MSTQEIITLHPDGNSFDALHGLIQSRWGIGSKVTVISTFLLYIFDAADDSLWCVAVGAVMFTSINE